MRTVAIVAVIAALAVGASALKEFEFEHENEYSFERYCKDFNKKYDPSEYVRRMKIYDLNIRSIAAHNRHSKAAHTYRQAVNKFTDMDDEERRTFLGFSMRKSLSQSVGARAAHESEIPAVDLDALPKSVDWRTKKNPSVITAVKDQGGCGSCWAHAATEQVEYAMAVATGKNPVPLSRQNIVDCAPNPDHCGGTGGCEGATAELGFAYVKDKGMASESAYPYEGVDGSCDESIPKSAQIDDWVVLPSNNYTAVVTAVATVAPLAITVAANSWFSYSSGVFTGCGQDYDLNHAVQLVGYGTAGSQDYWIVRNSWSAGWGEAGYIRILKHSDGGSQWCGVDSTPGDGTGCTNGPSEVTVCGSCGLWYDVCYATGGSVPAAPAAPAPAPAAPVIAIA